jgi:DUF1009 family protein
MLPYRIIENLRRSGRTVFALGISGEVAEDISENMDAWVGIGQLELARDLMQQAGVRDVVIVGGVQRPNLTTLELDAGGLWVVERALSQAQRGDNALLTHVLDYFEAQGFAIVSAADVLAQPRPLQGLLTEATIEPHQQDMTRAVEIASHIGALDIGQAAIVARGIVLGVESVEGTDAMLARVGDLSEEVRGTPDARAGVLAKIPKPQQDRRIDLPALGPQTVEGAARAGLAGIVFEADGVLFEALDACIEQANRAGLFLYGLTPEDL